MVIITLNSQFSTINYGNHNFQFSTINYGNHNFQFSILNYQLNIKTVLAKTVHRMVHHLAFLPDREAMACLVRHSSYCL